MNPFFLSFRIFQLTRHAAEKRMFQSRKIGSKMDMKAAREVVDLCRSSVNPTTPRSPSGDKLSSSSTPKLTDVVLITKAQNSTIIVDLTTN